MSQFTFDELKKTKKDNTTRIEPYAVDSESLWKTGQIMGDSQNKARMLMTAPANLMTPTIFSEKVQTMLKGLKGISTIEHDESWALEQGMYAFLSVSRGR